MPLLCPIFRRVLSRDPHVTKWIEPLFDPADLENIREVLIAARADYQATADGEYFIRSNQYVDSNDLIWTDFDEATTQTISTHLSNSFYQSYKTVEEKLNFDVRTTQKDLMSCMIRAELETRLPQPLKVTYLRHQHLQPDSEAHLRYVRITIAADEMPDGLVNHHEDGIDSDHEVENHRVARYRRLLRRQDGRYILTSPQQIRDA